MMNTNTTDRTVSVVGLFDTSNEAQNAIQDLVNHGITRDDISVVANSARGSLRDDNTSTATREGTGTVDGTTVGENVAAGTLFGGLGGLLIGLGALAIPGIGPVIAAGPIAATLAGAGFGALGGGIIGGLKQAGVPDAEADVYAEAVRRGGTIVTVGTDHARADEISDILNRNGAVDIDERGSSYREGGWSKFDHNAEPYNFDEEATRRNTTTYNENFREPGIMNSNRPGDSVSTPRNVRVYPNSRTNAADYDDTDFRNDYQARFGASNYSYDDVRPAYDYGYRMSQDERYRGRRFDVGSSRVDLQACKLEYSIVSPK